MIGSQFGIAWHTHEVDGMGSLDVHSLEILVTPAEQKNADSSIIEVAPVPKVVRLLEISNYQTTIPFLLIDNTAFAFVAVLHQQSLHVDILKVVVTVQEDLRVRRIVDDLQDGRLQVPHLHGIYLSGSITGKTKEELAWWRLQSTPTSSTTRMSFTAPS